MTGIRFLDELGEPRHLAIFPSQLSARQHPSIQTKSTLADYIVSMAVDAPQLELYSRVAADVRGCVKQSKEVHRRAEAEVAKVIPILFREYSTTDEETRAGLLVSRPCFHTRS